jgi:hypothetical protein
MITIRKHWIFVTSASILFLITILIVKISYERVSLASTDFPAESAKENSQNESRLNSKTDITIVNKTKNFPVVSNEIVKDLVNLTFKNSYDKSVRGFYLTVDSDGYFADLTYSEIKTEILPGETYSFQMPVQEFIYSNELIVQAVIFTNNSSDGDPSFVKEMQDQKRGEETQFRRGLQILKSFKFSENDYLTDLENLRKEIESLPIKDNNKYTVFESGLSFGKDILLNYFDRFNKGSSSVTDLKTNNSKIVSKLEEIISRQ